MQVSNYISTELKERAKTRRATFANTPARMSDIACSVISQCLDKPLLCILYMTTFSSIHAQRSAPAILSLQVFVSTRAVTIYDIPCAIEKIRSGNYKLTPAPQCFIFFSGKGRSEVQISF